MENQRPNVFPTKEQMEEANRTSELINKQLAEENKIAQYQVPVGEQAAAEEMKRRTAIQMAEREKKLAEQMEKAKEIDARREELRKNPRAGMTQYAESSVYNTPVTPQPPITPPPYVPPVSQGNGYNDVPSDKNNPYIVQLSQPQFHAAFDVIPLPSKGKLYRNKKPSVKVAYLNTSDENILTSPNLVQSGEFLEILINRKLLDTELRYRDLHTGDRNAIMLWLRATGYGHMYPIIAIDEDGMPFETEVNLNDLKTIELGAEPDHEGYFHFTLPLSKSVVKFRLLTVGDIEDIEAIVAKEKEAGCPVNNTATYTLEKQLVEVDGNRDPMFLSNFANSLRVGDGAELRKYIDKIESGVDLEIEVRTPRGGSISTFLPLNVKFFWPNL